MKVVVCIKQVPDTKGGVKFNPDGTLDRGAMLAIMNPDDKAGLEAALRLKDEYGAEVTVITMGLPKAADVLREALAMGADKAVLVTDRVLGGLSTEIRLRLVPRSQSILESLLSHMHRRLKSTVTRLPLSVSMMTDIIW